MLPAYRRSAEQRVQLSSCHFGSSARHSPRPTYPSSVCAAHPLSIAPHHTHNGPASGLCLKDASPALYAVSFGQRCETASAGAPAPPPPAGGGSLDVAYVQMTVNLQPRTVPTSGKGKARFESNLRSDIGAALGIVSSAVLIDSERGDTVRVDIFAPTVAEAQALQLALQGQLRNPSSDLLTGTVANQIVNPAATEVTLHAEPGPQCGEATWCAPNCCETLDGGGDGHGNFAIFVDNSFEAYVNGEEIGSSDQWATHVYHFDAPCGDGNIL